MSLQLMKERIMQSGNTLYHEQIKDARDVLAYGFIDDVSYNPDIVIYDTSCSIPIKIYDQKYSATYGTTAKYIAMHDTPVELGELLYDANRRTYWLCVESYDVSGIHNEGKLGKCMRFLKWQDDYGKIHEMPVIVTSAAKYNNGERGNEVVTLPSDQVMMYTKLTPDTIQLDRGVKFFIDENKRHPSVYEITRVDSALYTYMGKGFICILATECTYSPTEKELELGICNYHEVSDYLNPETETVKTTLNATIIGNTNLRNSFSRVYSVTFSDEFGNAVDSDNIDFNWNIVSGFEVANAMYDNKISLSVDDEELIGSSFLLQVFSNDVLLTETVISIID